MSYQVLSRKFRPQKFEDVIGQIHVSKTLLNAIKLGRVAHGYIFAGPRGVGKTTTARILAKAINCTSQINFNPCGECASCQSITEGRNIDVLEIDGASNRGIDDIRDLRENAKYPPTVGQYRVYIIDEVHMLTKEAFNALLKTLEEPPPFVVFILATTDPHKIPATILSRAQKFDFKRISVTDIISQLKLILSEEKIDYDDESLNLIALKADGGLRDALSMLDQIIAFTESTIELETVMSVLGLVQFSIFQDLLDTLFKGDKAKVLQLLGDTLSSGVAISDFISGFNEFVRNCMVFTVGGKTSIQMHETTREWLTARKDSLNTVDLMRILDMSLKYESGLKYLQHPKIGLETLMLKIASMDSSVELSELLRKMSNVQSGVPNASKSVSNEPAAVKTQKRISKPGVVSEPPVNRRAQTGTVHPEYSVEAIRGSWESFLEHMETVSAKKANFLEGSRILSFENNTLSIQIHGKPNGFKIKNLEKDSRVIEGILKAYYHETIKVRFSGVDSKEGDDLSLKKKKVKGIKEHPQSLYLIEKFEGELIR